MHWGSTNLRAQHALSFISTPKTVLAWVVLGVGLALGNIAHAQTSSSMPGPTPDPSASTLRRLTDNDLPRMSFVVVGKDLVKYNPALPKTPGGATVEVIYFFYYGSPWTYQVDQQLRQWAATRSYAIRFTPAPVMFPDNPYTVLGARVFFALQALHQENTLSPLLIEAIAQRKVIWGNMESLLVWMEAHGIARHDFLKALNAATTKSATASVPMAMEMYNIQSAPSVAIDGQYLIASSTAKPPALWLSTVEFAVEKLAQGGPRP